MVLTTEDKCKSKKNCCQTVINVMAENAYDLWLKEGNTGSLQDYLASMKGEKGDKGDPGEKGEKGDRLSIKDLFVQEHEMEELSKTLNKGDLVMMTNPSDPRHGTVYVWTGEEYQILTQLTNIDGAVGKSAYQIWLDLGNTGSEQDFIDSLKGSNTNVGTASLEKYLAELTNDNISTTHKHSDKIFRTFTWNSVTEWGTVHLDIRPSATLGDDVVIGKIPDDAPKPVTLIEVGVRGSANDGTGQISIQPDGKIRANRLINGVRYTVDLMGYYKK